jgi:hypothetical protein
VRRYNFDKKEDNSSGTIIAEYWYDTDGRRVKKVEYTDEGNKTTYYWDKDYETVCNAS